jgi:hypothetical protein
MGQRSPTAEDEIVTRFRRGGVAIVTDIADTASAGQSPGLNRQPKIAHILISSKQSVSVDGLISAFPAEQTPVEHASGDQHLLECGVYRGLPEDIPL